MLCYQTSSKLNHSSDIIYLFNQLKGYDAISGIAVAGDLPLFVHLFQQPVGAGGIAVVLGFVSQPNLRCWISLCVRVQP